MWMNLRTNSAVKRSDRDIRKPMPMTTNKKANESTNPSMFIAAIYVIPRCFSRRSSISNSERLHRYGLDQAGIVVPQSLES